MGSTCFTACITTPPHENSSNLTKLPDNSDYFDSDETLSDSSSSENNNKSITNQIIKQNTNGITTTNNTQIAHTAPSISPEALETSQSINNNKLDWTIICNILSENKFFINNESNELNKLQTLFINYFNCHSINWDKFRNCIVKCYYNNDDDYEDIFCDILLDELEYNLIKRHEFYHIILHKYINFSELYPRNISHIITTILNKITRNKMNNNINIYDIEPIIGNNLLSGSKLTELINNNDTNYLNQLFLNSKTFLNKNINIDINDLNATWDVIKNWNTIEYSTFTDNKILISISNKLELISISRQQSDHENEIETNLSKKEKEKRNKRAIIRTKAMKELIETEITYINLLQECINIFVDPLANNPSLLQNKFKNINVNRTLFNDIRIIYGVNCAFLADLKKKFEKWDNNLTRIGDEFKKFTPYFRSYQNYLNNYENASILLTRITEIDCNKYNSFNKWYNSRRAEYASNRSLDFYLILPIQRLPRYKLCLNEIIRNTEVYHPDLNDLRDAHSSINDTTMLCNERMKEYKCRKIVRDIEDKFIKTYSSLSTSLVTPSRIFIKKGTLWRLTRKGDEHELIFFLFNDLLCYASLLTDIIYKRRKDRNQLNNSNYLRLQNRMIIDDIFYCVDITNINNKIAMKRYSGRAFEIHSANKSIIVYANTISEKEEWLKILIKTYKNIQNSVKYKNQTRYELSAAIWVPDDWSKICLVSNCSKEFNSITRRRHHCRWCGNLICSSCGKYKLSHKIYINKMVKPVCIDCYKKYGKRYRANTNASLFIDDSIHFDDDEKTQENQQFLTRPH